MIISSKITKVLLGSKRPLADPFTQVHLKRNYPSLAFRNSRLLWLHPDKAGGFFPGWDHRLGADYKGQGRELRKQRDKGFSDAGSAHVSGRPKLLSWLTN